MKIYRIELLEEVRHVWEIEADSLEEAEEYWLDGDSICDAEQLSIEVVSVTEKVTK